MTIEFRYFARPHDFSNYSPESAPCDFCGETRPFYTGPFFGPDDSQRERICEECLASGKLDHADMTNNEGDVVALRRSLAEVAPELSAPEIERIAAERTVELESRTPSPQTWQDFFWPAHCGDYCRYLKEVGQPELVALAEDSDGPAYLAAHTHDVSDMEHAREIWESIRPDAPATLAQAYAVGVYLFQCLVCGRHVILWDAD